MERSIQQKQEAIKRLFAAASTPEEKYQIILDLGKTQPKLSPGEKSDKTLVHGCQSVTHLKATVENDRLVFAIESEALISAGLGQLLVRVYSGETPETILSTPPTYVTELGILAGLSTGRAHGFASMYERIRFEAFKMLQQSA